MPVSYVQKKVAARTGAAMPPFAKKGSAPGRFPIRNEADLRNAILAFGRAKPATRKAVAMHICRRAAALGLSSKVGPGIKKAAGYAH